MSNYINSMSIWGLMNKNSYINTDTDKLSYYKTKNKKKVVFFEKLTNEEEQQFDQINYMYLDEDPGVKGTSHSEQIVSILGKEIFEDLKGKKYREIRETIHKYSKKITVKHIIKDDLQYIIDMIEKWRYMDNGGMKYGWVEHAGIDKAIVQRYLDYEWSDNLIGLSFWDGDECIGYSLCEKVSDDIVDSKIEYKYLTRKVLNTQRNITEYIDWYTFKELWKIHKSNYKESDCFLINWGCSSGGVHWYKTHKWPVYSLEKKYFLTVKNKTK